MGLVRVTVLNNNLYIQCSHCFDIIQSVSDLTDQRIKQLCAKALEVQTEHEVNQVMEELRSALETHVRRAKESLKAEAANFSSVRHPHLRLRDM